MRQLLKASLVFTFFCYVAMNATAASLEQDTQKALETLVAGHKAGDLIARERGVKMLETVARKGSGDASFSLSAYYSGVLSADFPKDDTKRCYWSEMAASQKHVEAYWTVITCIMQRTPQSQKAAAFEQQALPWLRKITVESKDQEDIANARNTMQEWEDAMRSKRPVTLGGVLAAIGQIGTAESGRNGDARQPSSGGNRVVMTTEKAYVCTIYCNTASGPTIRHELTAKSRGAAAKATGEMADSLCRSNGHSRASALTLPERQCREQ